MKMKLFFLYLSLIITIVLINIKIYASENDVPNYENYVDFYIRTEKCQGYDFDPEEVKVIDLSSGRSTVMLNNGKKYWIYGFTCDCPNVILNGKDGYKELPDTCRFVIGFDCVNPENLSEGELFQWECTNKGWERMTSYREYWDDECAP